MNAKFALAVAVTLIAGGAAAIRLWPAPPAPIEAATRVSLAPEGEGLRRFDEPDAAYRYYVEQRQAPGETGIDYSRYEKAVAEAEKLRTYSSAGDQFFAPGERVAVRGWTDRGPSNVAGRTRVMRFRPGTPNTIYAAGVAGGLWRSTDRGVTWAPYGDLIPNIAISAMAIHPTTPDIMYIGTGEGFFNVDGVRGAGIFRSADGGLTWERLAGTTGSDFHYVNDLILSPNAPATTLYAATRTGLWRSTDTGVTFTRFINAITANGCFDIAARTDTAADTLIVGCGTFAPTAAATGIWESANANAVTPTFTQRLAPAALTDMGRISVAIAPSLQSTMYALITTAEDGAAPTQANNNGLRAVYRSINSGVTWAAQYTVAATVTPTSAVMSDLLLSNGREAKRTFCGIGGANSLSNQGWYDNVIEVDPVNANRIWAGGVDLFRSDDAGASWGVASYWWAITGNTFYAHADQHGIFFDPGYNGVTNTRLWASNDGGIVFTDNPNATLGTNNTNTNQNSLCLNATLSPSDVDWARSDTGYNVTQFYHGDVYPTGTQYVGGTQDNGTNRNVVASTTFNQIFGGDGGYVQIDPLVSTTIYAETQFLGLVRSINGGTSFSAINAGIAASPRPFIAPFTLDKANPIAGVTNRLYAGSRALWRNDSATTGNTWTQVTAETGGTTCNNSTSGCVTTIAVAPGLPNLVLVGRTGPNSIHRITNATTATTATVASTSIAMPGTVSQVVFVDNETGSDPATRTAYATVSTFGVNHVFISTDGGSTFTSIDGVAPNRLPDVPAHTIAVDTRYSPALRSPSRRLYVGTDIGVFVSLDGGSSWARENTGFANVPVEHLQIRQVATRNDELYAFTHGRGVFQGTLSAAGQSCNSSIAAAIPDASATGINNTLNVNLPSAANVTDIDVAVNVSHTRPGDLTFTLTHVPTNTTVTLLDQPGVPATGTGCTTDDVSAVFDDDADLPAESSCAGASPGITGRFRIATGSLSSFNGLTYGAQWRLTVRDLAAGETGTLNSFCVTPTGDRATTVPALYAEISSRAIGAQTELQFTTAANLGTVAFEVLAGDGSGVLARIASLGDSSAAQRYTATFPTRTDGFYLRTIEADGSYELSKRLSLGERFGEGSNDAPAINWSAVRALSTAPQRTQAGLRALSTADVELVVARSGIQRLRFEDLLSAGELFAGVPIAEIALTLRDVPQPLSIDSTDSQFGPGDVIWFIGDALDRPGNTTAELSSLLSRENIYRLQRASSLARRAALVRSSTANAPALTRAPFTQRVEENKVYSFAAPGEDPFAHLRVVSVSGAASGALTFNYEGDPDSATSLRISVFGGINQGGVAPDHSYAIELNDVRLGAWRFDGLIADERTVALPPGVLRAGLNTARLVVLGDTGFNADVVFLEELQFSGERELRALDGSLTVTLNGQRISGGRVKAIDEAIFIDGFEQPAACEGCQQVQFDAIASASAVVFRQLSDRTERITGLQALGAQQISATVPVGSDERWLIADARGIQQPGVRAPVDHSMLLDGKADYLIISHPQFIPGLSAFVASKQAAGRQVKVVSIDAVYGGFSHGVTDARAISRYLQAAKDLGVRDVLLVGGDTLDALNDLGTQSVSFVPTAYVPTSDIVRFAPSDVALVPSSMTVGRLPVRTETELQQLLAKISAFAQPTNQRALIAADTSTEVVRFDELARYLGGMTPALEVDYALLDEVPAGSMQSTILSRARAGDRMLQWLGHAAPGRWSSSNVLTSAALLGAGLDNFAQPNAVLQWGCWTSYFVEPRSETLSNAWLLQPGGAAVALGASTLTEVTHDIAMAREIAQAASQPGEISIGEALRLARIKLLAQSPEMRDVVYGIQLLGDPSAPLPH